MKINELIDHTLLAPDTTKEEIVKLCEEAKKYKFKSVCINPSWVELAANLLKSSDVEVCTVIGFPLGANKTSIKVAETISAIEDGATEIDMVLNIGRLKQRDEEFIFDEINAITSAANGKIVKVIIETALLTDEEIELAAKIISKSTAKFVKTSTGFAKSGANIKDVKIIKNAINDSTEIKASGGIRTAEDVLAYYEAGVTRIGTSNGIAILEDRAVVSDY